MLALVDSNCHLDFPEFDADRSQVIARSRAAGVVHFLISGTEPGQWQRAQTLCRDIDACFYAVGLHPWWLEVYVDGLRDSGNPSAMLEEKIAAYTNDPACVAIGECGLDRLRCEALEQQLFFLQLQVNLAIKLQCPLILHCVKAHSELLSVLKKYRPPCGGVVHGFSGSYEIAKQYMDLGFLLGIGGTITYPRAKKTRDAIKRMPMNALLLETDAPSMPLAGRQGQRNSPECIPYICAELASLKNLAPSDVAAATTKNFRRLFNLN